MFLAILVACILSAILYRMGGSNKWDTKWRDIGCSLVLLALVGALFGFRLAFWWAYLITFGLSWGFLSTYWDSVFGYDNFWFHGLGCGLAGIPLIWAGVHFSILAIRLIICTVGMGLWSKFIKRDIPQELGRGVLFIL